MTTTAKHFALTLALTLFALLANVQAQTPRMATVNITPDADKVHISTIGDVSEMRVDVADEQGGVVFQSGQITGQQLDWNMKDTQGERVAAGTYLVTVTFRNASGKVKKRVEQVTVDEAEKADTKRTAAPEAVQAAITGAGATGKIAKFTGAATIANSIITESAGKIGIGNAAPKHTLSILNGPAWTANGWKGAIELGNATAIGWQKNSQNWRFGMGHTTDGFAMFHTLADPGTQTANGAVYDFFISNTGNVGIGTTNPIDGKLNVFSSGGYAVYAKSTGVASTAVYAVDSGSSASGRGVYGSSSNGYGVYGDTATGYAGYFNGKARVTGNLQVGSCTGCSPPSDRNLKANFSSVNSRFILDRLATLPIKAWNYKSEDATTRHIGPMAQDFRSAFGLGTDDHTLNTVDAQGVTMAAIQGLYQMMQEKDRQIQQQSSQIAQQSHQIEQLQVQLNQVKRTIKRKRSR